MNCDETVELIDESEEQSEDYNNTKASDVALSGSDWTTETILSQLRQGNIDLNPRFQRRDAWSLVRKSRFIESLILGLPTPQIVLAEKTGKGQRGQFLVLDGKQRLLTLSQFAGESSGKYANFKLKGLDVRKDLNDKSFSDFKNDFCLLEDLNTFNNQTIRTVVIRFWKDIDFLHLVFQRLNSNSVALSPQELRQSLFPGHFSEFIDERAATSKQLQNLLGNKEPDFRMRDIEILIRFLGFSFFLNQYSGNLSGFLDFTCKELTRTWEKDESQIKSRVDDFESAIDCASTIFGENNVGRKWTGNNFEGRLNRAILDVQTFYFSNLEIREISLKNSEQLKISFKKLCTENNQFRNSIETTTKSLNAVFDRIQLWGSTLQDVTGLRFSIPALNAERKRIIFESLF